MIMYHTYQFLKGKNLIYTATLRTLKNNNEVITY